VWAGQGLKVVCVQGGSGACMGGGHSGEGVTGQVTGRRDNYTVPCRQDGHQDGPAPHLGAAVCALSHAGSACMSSTACSAVSDM
jgi:hypothetical protein